ncbi:hypothetical protein XF35_25690 [Streptomyces platensis subsp. clarensis]|nr:hypothetical protein [Streptomyces platensis subsp. clarensis]
MSDSDFAAQVAAKLESIAKEIDELQKLKAKLEDLQKHLGAGSRKAVVAPQPAEPEPAVTKPVTVPSARRAQAAAPKAKPASKPPAKVAKSAKKKTRKAKPARATAGRQNSTRADRVLALLDEQPRTVSEMTKLLTQQHPDQSAPETAVRNTLETSLVAKGLAHRSKQGRSVFYSRPAAGAGTQEAEAAVTQEEAASTPA